MFEAARIPPSWVTAGRQHDLIILPTESSRRAWIASGIPRSRVRLCPLGIDADLYSEPTEPLALRRDSGEPIAGHRVRFLNVSALGPRKNLSGLLRAWLLATSPQDDAILVLKIGRYAPGWLEVFRYEVEALQARLGKRLEEAAPVHLISDLLADAEMPRLYAAATHYISLSFGEGWDQPMVEAAASGLRLIAPSHSAYPTYLDTSVAQLLPSREVPAVFPGGGITGNLFEGVSWWEPDEAAAIAAIRAAIAGHDADKASARDRILRDFTWERATRRLLEVLDDVAVRRRRPALWPGRLWNRR
jgi:glycosyltransferase involved in cell wall biosynthesis